MRLLLLLALLSSCGKKTIYSIPPMPEDQASPVMKAEISDELQRLEDDFADLGVSVDLHKLPVVVADLPHRVVGRCQYRQGSEGAYIVLSPLLFPPRGSLWPIDDPNYEKEYVRVLIHEIGHCYFHRQHERPAYLEAPGISFELRFEGSSVTYDRIPKSLMPAESLYRMPRALRKYYLSELVGKAELTNQEVLGEFTEFQALGQGDTVLTAEDEAHSPEPGLKYCQSH